MASQEYNQQGHEYVGYLHGPVIRLGQEFPLFPNPEGGLQSNTFILDARDTIDVPTPPSGFIAIDIKLEPTDKRWLNTRASLFLFHPEMGYIIDSRDYMHDEDLEANLRREKVQKARNEKLPEDTADCVILVEISVDGLKDAGYLEVKEDDFGSTIITTREGMSFFDKLTLVVKSPNGETFYARCNTSEFAETIFPASEFEDFITLELFTTTDGPPLNAGSRYQDPGDGQVLAVSHTKDPVGKITGWFALRDFTGFNDIDHEEWRHELEEEENE